MSLGYILDEEYTAKLLELASFMGVVPHAVITNAIDTMWERM